MAKSIIVDLPPDERKILLEMAKSDLRDPNQLIRLLIRNEAIKRSLWPPTEGKHSESDSA